MSYSRLLCRVYAFRLHLRRSDRNARFPRGQPRTENPAFNMIEWSNAFTRLALPSLDRNARSGPRAAQRIHVTFVADQDFGVGDGLGTARPRPRPMVRFISPTCGISAACSRILAILAAIAYAWSAATPTSLRRAAIVFRIPLATPSSSSATEPYAAANSITSRMSCGVIDPTAVCRLAELSMALLAAGERPARASRTVWLHRARGGR